MYIKLFCGICLVLFCLDASRERKNEVLTRKLKETYQLWASKPQSQCDIGEHLKHLRRLASESEIVVELGTREMVSTLGLLIGLQENGSRVKKYLGVDLRYPETGIFKQINKFADSSQIDFRFIIANDIEIDPMECDLLFIDTLHTYRQLTLELEKFSPKVKKYIAMHDTDKPWGWEDEPDFTDVTNVYPDWINPTKRGLFEAVEDFLARHPEWVKQEQHTNCHGFTVLKRV